MSEIKEETQLIVGVGASAGGLDVLKHFFNHVPTHANIAFIVVQHLAPDHDSMLASILARETSYQFCQAEDGQKIESGHAYIIPPGRFIEVCDHTIRLVEQTEHRGARMAIDHLFRSMAEMYKSKAVGLLFSGAGSDGTAGLRALKAAGGLAVVQCPETAEYPSMPKSAINAGVVDEILPVEKIPDLLIKFGTHPYHAINSEDDSSSTDLNKIRALLKAQENFDLAQYKDSTVKRRIFRRMSLTGKKTAKDYIALLRESQSERGALLRDLLINVTDFFRDREAFKILDSKVLANIVDEIDEGEDVRVWVAGCASGEEAYTLAILLTEQIEKSGKDVGLRIFATDIDMDAIQTARKGSYPSSIIAELPKPFIDKYFEVASDGYATIRNSIRDTISFAQQNVYTDPPFSNLHLVSCRNLLIYLQKSAQQKVLKSFFYSLIPEGYLFLGSSESVGEKKELFTTLSSKWRIYCRKERNEVKNYPSILPTFFNDKNDKSRLRSKEPHKQNADEERALRTLLLAVKPSIIVDEENRVSYFHGNVNKFLALPDGHAGLDLYSMIDPGLRTRMRSGIYKARKTGERVSIGLPRPATESESSFNYRCIITPTSSDRRGEGNVIVTFEEIPLSNAEHDLLSQQIDHHDHDSMIEAMEKELRETKEELQNTVEELETSTEELKAAHEEALSTNEELQSSNEELEASTEELRSLNEELTTVNAQLKDKIDELSTTHDDIKNFFASTNLATIFLSSDMRIKRFTPAAERLLRIGSQDIDQPINELCRDLIDEDTLEEAKRVLDSLESSEKQIHTDSRWYVRKILPYQTESRKVDGVVITFIDVTKLKVTANRLKSSSEQHAVIAKLGMKALSNEDTANLMDQLVREVTHTLKADFCKVLEYQPEQEQLLVKAGIGWNSGIVGHATVPSDNGSQAGFTLHTPEPVVVTDLATEQRFNGPDLLIDHKVVSGISCIIENGDKPYGVLGVHTKDKRVFNQEDVHFLVSAANILSVALHRKGMEQQLKSNENRLRIAKDSSHMGAFEWDIDSGKTYWDKLLYEIWGIRGSSVSQDDFIKGVHEEDRDSVTIEIQAAMDPKRDGHYHAVYRVVNSITQKVTWVEANGQVLFSNGQPHKMIGMVVDITRQRKLEASLKNAIKELQEADEKKNDFLATLGHEIRNPLASISGAVQIIEHDKTKLDWALNSMRSNVNLVSSLLDELLDLTRISRGEVRLDRALVNVNQLLKEVVENFSTSIHQNKQSIHLSLPPEEIRTTLDRTRIQQVINNIINNASKFTPDNGSIEIELARAHNQVIINVKDSGIGLDMQYKDKVFEPFQQIKADGERKNTGLGIGLSLVKQIADLHGGSVSIHSEGRHKGTLVSLTLPLLTEDLDNKTVSFPQGGNNKNSSLRNMQKLRVMLVDDNETVADGLGMILDLKGCDVRVYNTASEAIQNYLTFKPNVALLDIGLPDMSGIELIEILKPNLPEQTLFLAVTGYGHLEAKRSTQAAGFDGHFNKPVSVETILNELEKFAEAL
ncbi:ATP-binding protein [Alteromonas ponticola]|uniref:ATP-binding protein n=1 Tax=Alteromonas aquimaris TaxID=2998417 RepID=A0ABT3P563_9ALTE|nr:chemotaxis protein CheB [Alteromonas aquimaris]MCW8107906.1 ATP-binding protein [Alteromonas aquimaris]